MDYLQKFWEIILPILENADATGLLDGVPFKKVSIAGSGVKGFVIKGWVNTEEGPMVRYRANWDKLKEGEVFFQKHPSDNGWQETIEHGFKLERSDGLALVLGFQTEDGVDHKVSFKADIELDPKWWQNLGEDPN